MALGSGIVSPPTQEKRGSKQLPTFPSILDFVQVKYVSSWRCSERFLQRRAHGTQTPVNCLWYAQWLVKEMSRITSSGGFIYYYVCNYSLGSWRICGSIFLASSRTPSSCGRLVRASSLWEVLRWLTLGFVSSSIDIPISLSEPSWGGATLAEPQAQARLKNDCLPQIPACGSGLSSSICFVNFFWWWPSAAPV